MAALPSEFLKPPQRTTLDTFWPVIIVLLPYILFVPYRWLLFDSPASADIVKVNPRLGEEHRRANLVVFWFLTFGPFAVFCFLTSLLMAIRRTSWKEHP
jgi:hypothetical protein